jgi:hypothetical protein
MEVRMETEPVVDDLNKPQKRKVAFDETMSPLVDDPPRVWFYLLWVIVLVPLSFPMIFSGILLHEAIKYEYFSIEDYYRRFFIGVLIFIAPIVIATFHISTRCVVRFADSFREIRIKRVFRPDRCIELKSVSRLVFYVEYRYLIKERPKNRIHGYGRRRHSGHTYQTNYIDRENQGYFRYEKIQLFDYMDNCIFTYRPLTKYCNEAFVDLFDRQSRFAITFFPGEEKKILVYDKRVEFTNFKGNNADMVIIIEKIV